MLCLNNMKGLVLENLLIGEIDFTTYGLMRINRNSTASAGYFPH